MRIEFEQNNRMVSVDRPNGTPAASLLFLGGSGPVDRHGLAKLATAPHVSRPRPLMGTAAGPYDLWADGLTHAGVAVVRMDKRRASEFDGATWPTTIADEYRSDVLDMLLSLPAWDLPQRPIVLLGHSLGAAAALSLAPELVDLDGVVGAAVPVVPITRMITAQAAQLSASAARHIDRESSRASYSGDSGTILGLPPPYWRDLAQWNLADALGRSRDDLPIALVHGTTDPLVGIDDVLRARRRIVVGQRNLSWALIEGADHFLIDQTGKVVLDPLIDWFNRTFDND